MHQGLTCLLHLLVMYLSLRSHTPLQPQPLWAFTQLQKHVLGRYSATLLSLSQHARCYPQRVTIPKGPSGFASLPLPMPRSQCCRRRYRQKQACRGSPPSFQQPPQRPQHRGWSCQALPQVVAWGPAAPGHHLVVDRQVHRQLRRLHPAGRHLTLHSPAVPEIRSDLAATMWSLFNSVLQSVYRQEFT